MADLGKETVTFKSNGRVNEHIGFTKLPATPLQMLRRPRRTESPDEASSTEVIHEAMYAGYDSSIDEEAAPKLAVVSYRQVQMLQKELARRQHEYEHRLALEREQGVALFNQATEIACSLRDSLTELSAEAVQLRSRVEQLEEELSKRKNSGNAESMSHQGNVELIAALQVELADLERKLQRAQRARTAAVEANMASEQRAEILAAQVEQLVALLDAERLERAALAQTLEDLYLSESLT